MATCHEGISKGAGRQRQKRLLPTRKLREQTEQRRKQRRKSRLRLQQRMKRQSLPRKTRKTETPSKKQRWSVQQRRLRSSGMRATRISRRGSADPKSGALVASPFTRRNADSGVQISSCVGWVLMNSSAKSIMNGFWRKGAHYLIVLYCFVTHRSTQTRR